MNILAITNQLSMGGAEHFVVRLSNELAHRRHQVTVLTSGGDLVRLLDEGVTHVTGPARAKTPQGLWRLSRQIDDLIEAHDIQVVHANSPTTAMAASMACWKRAIPVVTSAHGSWTGRVKPFVARMFSVGSDRVVGCSEALTNDLIRHGLNPRKSLTIHNGIPYRPTPPDPELRAAVRAELGLPAEAPVIIFVARFAPDKGLGDLLNAMAQVLWRRPDARLLLAGSGEMLPACEAQARKLGIEASVQFLGFRNDVNRLLAAADVFTLPSLDEGLPLSVAEAMAAGLPVVATPVGGVPEIVLDNLTGFLVEPRSPARLGEALLKLLADPVLARRMGQAGRIHVAANFTLDQMVSRFEALYMDQLEVCTIGRMQRAFLS